MSGTVAAHADEPPSQPPLAHYYFRLDYRVAPGLRGCLSRADVRELLAGQLDYDAIHQDEGPGQIVLDLSRQGGKVQARMVVDGAGEHWEATIGKASTCEDITLDALVNLNAAVTMLILIPLQKKTPVPVEPKAKPAPPPPSPPAAPPPCACTVEPPPLPVLGDVGLRLGGERMLTRALALRAYVEVMAQPLSGSVALENDNLVRVIWPGSVVSGSIGLGPVLYFDTQ
ncbi:MAG: hypothetical protein ABI134_19390 [Byssovorax sp.]